MAGLSRPSTRFNRRMLTAFAPGPSRLPIAAWTKAWAAGTSPAMTAMQSRPPALPNAMKIAELKTFVVGNPPPAFGGRYFLFLKLKTD